MEVVKSSAVALLLLSICLPSGLGCRREATNEQGALPRSVPVSDNASAATEVASSVASPTPAAVSNSQRDTKQKGRTTTTSTGLTGLSPTRSDLQANQERALIDPAADGWFSEAFHANALTQLRMLADWIGHDSTPLPAIFSDPLRSTTLRPTDLTEVLRDEAFVVRRPGKSEFAAKLLTSEELRSRLSTLRVGEQHRHAEFKIVSVTETDQTFTTQVRGHISGLEEACRWQLNFTWHCLWTAADTSTPQLTSVELVEFEEVQFHASTPLFSDRTPSVLDQVSAYREQLSYPLDHWRDRMDWRFGWEVVGAHGVTVADVDGDGLDDVYVCEAGGLPNRLLLQQPDGTVRDASRHSTLDIIEPTRSALFLDLDNDGDQDLFVAVSRYLFVFENLGRTKFRRVAAYQTASLIRSLCAADVDNNGLLDVYACGYSLRNPDTTGLGRPVPYHDANNGAPNYLYRNRGNLQFEDVTAELGLDSNNRRFSYAAAWEDYDRDGDLDLYVANDFGRNNLFRNDDGRFRDVAAQAGVEDLAAGMSVTWGDYNRDGLPDLYVSNMFSSAGNRIAYQRNFHAGADAETRSLYQRHARGNSLFENQGDGTFRDVSESANVTEGRWAWSSNFADINNDGWLDVLVGNGMVSGTDDTGDL